MFRMRAHGVGIGTSGPGLECCRMMAGRRHPLGV
jgi:hypothetical protein